MKLCVFVTACVLIAILICTTKNVDTANKICVEDSDCRFVATRCCPDCNDFESVNLVSANRIEEHLVRKCRGISCTVLFCESSTGQAVYGEPACLNNRCSVRNKINCDVFCRYYDNEEYENYLIKTEEILGKNSTELARKCKCA